MPADEGTRARYLAEVLALTPGPDTERILELRRAFHEESRLPTDRRGRRPVASARGDVGATERERAERVLREVRESFWERPPAESAARLASLELDDLPDLARYRDRLLRVTDVADRVDALAEEPDVHPAFTGVLRAVLPAPEREAAKLRAEHVQSATSRGWRRMNQRAIGVLARRYPELHELEAAWFRRILRARKDRRDSRALRGGIGCIGVYFLVRAVVKLVQWLLETDGGAGL